MWIILLVFVPGILSKDYILEDVRKNVNHTVNPCDNFYRHACPIQSIGNLRQATVHSILSMKFEQENKAPLKKSIIEKLYDILSKAGQKLPSNEIFKMLENLRNTAYLLTYMEDNNIQSRKDVLKLKTVAENIMNTARNNFQKSLLLDKTVNDNYTSGLIDQLNDHILFFGMELERNLYQEFHYVKDIMDEIYENRFKTSGKPPITEADVLERSEEFNNIIELIFTNIAGILKEFNPIRMLNINKYDAYNAYNMGGNIVLLLETVLLAARHTVSPTSYGSFGWVFGHELMHSFLKADNIFSEKYMEMNGLCVMKHATKMCKVFGEKDCFSGIRTYTEDAPDFEGAKLAYESFLKEIGDKLNEPVVHDLNITNQQMFFYSMAKQWCKFPSEHNRRKLVDGSSVLDGHSPEPVRVNGAISLINGFHEAFNCRPGDRMMDVNEKYGKCNYFGKEVR